MSNNVKLFRCVKIKESLRIIVILNLLVEKIEGFNNVKRLYLCSKRTGLSFFLSKINICLVFLPVVLRLYNSVEFCVYLQCQTIQESVRIVPTVIFAGSIDIRCRNTSSKVRIAYKCYFGCPVGNQANCGLFIFAAMHAKLSCFGG